MFWRVAVNDVYSNGGYITDYEAYQLLVDDGDNNGLFDTWEMNYFGHTGNDPNADPDGDGLTNLLESEYQTNPLDYYNGYTPSVELLSGTGQRGSPDTILATPLAISVSHGASNAPLQITVTQGEALLSLNGTDGWVTSVDTHTNSTFTNASGNTFPCAKVYIKLPNNTGDVSNITATAGTGTLTASTTAWAAVSDTSLPPPTGLIAVPTGPSTVHLTWIPGDSSQPTTIEFSTDGGNTWHTAATVAAGISEMFFNGLNPDHAIQFRVLTGGTPSASDGQNPPTFTIPNGQTPPITGTIVSPPGTPASAIPVSAPTLLGVQATTYGFRYGFNGFLTPTNIYLKRETHIISDDTDNDGDSGDSTLTEIYDDPKTGHITDTVIGTPWGGGYGGEWTNATNTTRTRMGTDDDGSGETSTTTETLSMEYTSAMFQSNVESWITPYPDTFSTNINTASISLTPEPVDAANSYFLTKLKYKWRVNSIPGQVVNWLEIFTPADGTNPIAESKSWTPGTSETESQTYEIDPSTRNGKKNGTYSILPADITVAFGLGPEPLGEETSRQLLEDYLDGIKVARSGDVWFVKHDDAQGHRTFRGVEIVTTKEKLIHALEQQGRTVVFDGHSNFGLGPNFSTKQTHKTIADFTHFGTGKTSIPITSRGGGSENDIVQFTNGDGTTLPTNQDDLNAIDRVYSEGWAYLTVQPGQIITSPQNYTIPSLGIERFKNLQGVLPGSTFTKQGTGVNEWHFGDSESPKRLIVQSPSSDLPPLGYARFFYNACHTERDYTESFQHGTFVSTTDKCFVGKATKIFVQGIVEDKSTQDIMTALNQKGVGANNPSSPIYALKNF